MISDELSARAVQSSDPVHHPSHYTGGPPCPGCGRPIECIDITRTMGFCLGNVIKYAWRSALKGHQIEDLEKARQYLDFEIELLKEER